MDAAKIWLLKDMLGQNKRQFNVPVYQRNYDWKIEHCKKLFDDICNASKENKKHFTGTIVYIYDKSGSRLSECSIIDGQQRITTIILLLKAIYDIAQSKNNVDVVNDIEEYLFNRNCDEEYRLRLKQIKKANFQLVKLLNNQIDDMDFESSIYKNYMCFKRSVESQLLTGVTLEEILRGIEQLEVVEIVLEKEKDSPQLIFESINSTGLELSGSDLIRNFLLMELEYKEQEELFENYWLWLEENLKAENLESYVKDFLIMKEKTLLKGNDTYQLFKDLYEKNGYSNRTILEELKKYGNYYKVMITKSDNYSKAVNKSFNDFRILNSSTINPFLLKLLEDYDNKIISEVELLKILNFLINYLLRRLIVGTPSNSLRKLFSDAYSKIFKNSDNKNKYFDSIQQYFVSIKTRDGFVADIEFSKELATQNIYAKKNACKYLLSQIENNNSEEMLMVDSLTIEHIMPQTLNHDWKEMLGEDYKTIQEQYLHTIGNLNLTGYNSLYSNNSFDIKKKEMKEKSKANILNEYVLKQDTWSKTQIKERADLLVNKILEIYPYPKNVDSTIKFDLYDKYYLDDEQEIESYLDIVGVGIGDVELQANSIVDACTKVYKKLYEDDKNIFEQIATEGYKLGGIKNYIKHDSNEMTKVFEVGDGIFIETSFNKIYLLKMLKDVTKIYGYNQADVYISYVNQ